eukprot:CAMPEP_0206445598 /NCGR_PEP_ID=MMETSP0324_2-20121206/15617_1 /ASSEMBLY_ACC=CAM_ASM_000836 /TAXON_ID=2866 /ORGANISM="Crypthecodinium cohnii, Strain Seligo" /LENGTH=345 /DNA_ID=CAMNT_0053913871 /DNA_START=105 /DNA_END=1140 /DNA_ORIENTATION=+
MALVPEATVKNVADEGLDLSAAKGPLAKRLQETDTKDSASHFETSKGAGGLEEVDLQTLVTLQQKSAKASEEGLVDRHAGVNNKALLEMKLQEIDYKVPEGAKRVPWVDTMVIDATQELPKKLKAKDGVKLETAFMNAAAEATKEAYRRLRVMKIPCTRPNDFYAEMMKTDKQMFKVKQLAAEETRRIKIVEERRKAQAAKKYQKNARTTKLKAKADEKRQTLEDIKKWKDESKKKNGDAGDLEDILDKKGSKGKASKSKKREAADKKFGFGGKKRFSKSNTAESTNDMSDSPWAKKSKGKAKEKAKEKEKEKERGEEAVEAESENDEIESHFSQPSPICNRTVC